MIKKSIYTSPLGDIIISARDNAIVGVHFSEQRYLPGDVDKYELDNSLNVIVKAKRWLDAYFNGENRAVDFTLSPEGSDFRQLVWAELIKIPYGKTTTYGSIASRLEEITGRRMSAQAVGGAIGHNPIGIIIPCHRVVGANGTLTGYAGGLDKKEYLLKLEGVIK